ncbi:hypothetical protein [Stutzerimonas stutzeri]|uniref:hypothetical protein n=1 Tax=Stutzerimonas stutzeri TaxID=316 RepID=UPI00244D1DF9|nr:hypothetical protein [Stutzerimonas stutzeri]MDH1587977.1 hypothetical protein [Stutzerimonas stutzeri]
MTTHTLNPSNAHSLPPSLVATALIGEALIQYRIHKTPEQQARLQALADMAKALGALSPSDWQFVTGGV